MKSTRFLSDRKRTSGKRIPDVKIIIAQDILYIKYPKHDTEGFIAKTDPRAIKILNFIRI